MLKNISSLGKVLTREEQKQIAGGKQDAFAIEKCCKQIPSQGSGGTGCNSSAECIGKPCGCS